MKIALTGYTGFLGSVLHCDLISQSHEVIPIGRKPLQSENTSLQYIDINNVGPNYVIDEVDIIIHCAGLAHQTTTKYLNPIMQKTYWDTNVELTRKIMEIAVSSEVKKVIFISTIKVNQSQISDEIISGTDINYDNYDIYAQTKSVAEKIVCEISQKNQIEYIVFRPTVMYGKHVKGNLKKIEHFFKSRNFAVLPFGNFTNKKSFLSVYNFSNLITIACKNSVPSGIYLAADDIDYSLSEICRLYADRYKTNLINIKIPSTIFRILSHFPPIRRKYDKLNGKYCVSNQRTKEIFNWHPKDTLSSFLQEKI